MTCPKDCQDATARNQADIEKLEGLHKKDISDIKKVLFGEHGRTGIVGCLNKFVTKRSIVWTVVTILSLSTAIIVYGMGSYANTKEKVTVVCAQVETNSKNIDTLNSNQRQILHKIENIEKKIMTPKEMEAAVKKAMREVIGQPR